MERENTLNSQPNFEGERQSQRDQKGHLAAWTWENESTWQPESFLSTVAAKRLSRCVCKVVRYMWKLRFCVYVCPISLQRTCSFVRTKEELLCRGEWTEEIRRHKDKQLRKRKEQPPNWLQAEVSHPARLNTNKKMSFCFHSILDMRVQTV